jgi:hypothetical protein
VITDCEFDNDPCRSEPARDGDLPSTIDFKQAIKNRKLSPSGLSELKDRSLNKHQSAHSGAIVGNVCIA